MRTTHLIIKTRVALQAVFLLSFRVGCHTLDGKWAGGCGNGLHYTGTVFKSDLVPSGFEDKKSKR